MCSYGHEGCECEKEARAEDGCACPCHFEKMFFVETEKGSQGFVFAWSKQRAIDEMARDGKTVKVIHQVM